MKIKAEYKIRDIAGEKVIILQGSNGADMTRLVSLNSSAEWLYRQLEGKEFERADIADLLQDYFEIDSETALRDSETWIRKLEEFGVIEN